MKFKIKVIKIKEPIQWEKTVYDYLKEQNNKDIINRMRIEQISYNITMNKLKQIIDNE